MEIRDAFGISHRGTVLAGRVVQGSVRVGDRAVLKTVRGDIPTHITGVEIFRKLLDVAHEGDEVGLLCRNLNSTALDGNYVGDDENRKLEGVLLVSAAPRWWEFWRN